jgi:hypothetical protein
MRRLDAFAHVENMIGASAALLDEAIAYMEMEAAAARQAIRNEGPSNDPDLSSTEDSVDVVLSARGLTTDNTVKAAASARSLDPSNDAVSARRFASDDISSACGLVIDSSTRGLATDEFGPAGRDPVPADPRLFADDAEPVARATAASDVARDEGVIATNALSPRAMVPNNDAVVGPLDSIELVPDDRVHSTDDSLKFSSARRLAEAMLQAGTETGQMQGPSPALLHIAHQVLDTTSSASPRCAPQPAPPTSSTATTESWS